ncbi:MAG: carboxypeptidase regulatory-like domain-containing protein [Vicinamibacterales bacterium]
MLVATEVASAQGVQTGTIRGIIRDEQGLVVPGVSVTATSGALQRPRTTVSDIAGAFALPALPPGVYQVEFVLQGFTTLTRTTTVALGLTVEQNVTMRTAAVTETVEVIAETPADIATPVVGINVLQAEVEALATPRTLQGIATLSPALTERSPNVGQVIINGAFAFDNVFMVNGVDVNDNLFATPQNLFVEEAIQETQVLTSGISAEYGRFSGGVINAVTKSGSNAFSGSYRLNLLNPGWTTETPFQVARNQTNPDTLQRTQEMTLGGPILRDRLWFFAAGRLAGVDNVRNLPQTGIQLLSNDKGRRGELKLTGTVATNHTIQGGFLNNPRTVTNDSGLQSFVIDPRSEQTRKFPNHYYFTNYRGVIKGALFQAQYSQRKFRFDNSGGTSTSIIDSPFLSATQCVCLYNAPYFDATDPTGRNNRQLTANSTFFWNLSGRHDTKVGYEFFRSQLVGGNSQSSTNYVFNVDFLETASGAPALDSQGRLMPNFVPGESYIEYYPATRGATMNVNNNSLFVQDHWVINGKFSADLGLRFEQVKVVSTGNIVSVNTNPRIVPRLGFNYDLNGDGENVVHVTYGQYSGRYNEAQIGGNSPVGNPAYLPTYYQGPAGSGLDFAAGLNVANYPIRSDNLAGAAEVPVANIFVDSDLKTPVTHEFMTSFGRSIGENRGFAEVSYVFRKTVNMIEDFTTRPDGTTNVVLEGLDLGTVSNIVYRNTDLARRQYQALIMSTRYRPFSRLDVNGHYTIQLKNHGNYEGEGSNLPGNPSWIGDYPEAISEERYYPYGRLQNFQRHKLRVWSIFNQNLGAYGRMSISGLWRVDSGLAYSLIARSVAPNATQRATVTAAGYPEAPGSGNVYFGGRGTEMFKGAGPFDTSINYEIPVFRSLRPWLKFDVFNLFNNLKLVAWNTTISPDPNSPRDALGIPTGYVQSAAFGTASGNTVTNGDVTNIPTYPQWSGGNNGGRTFRFAFGLRF